MDGIRIHSTEKCPFLGFQSNAICISDAADTRTYFDTVLCMRPPVMSTLVDRPVFAIGIRSGTFCHRFRKRPDDIDGRCRIFAAKREKRGEKIVRKMCKLCARRCEEMWPNIPVARRLADTGYHAHRIPIVFDLPTRHFDRCADATAAVRQHADCIDVCGHVAAFHCAVMAAATAVATGTTT